MSTLLKNQGGTVTQQTQTHWCRALVYLESQDPIANTSTVSVYFQHGTNQTSWTWEDYVRSLFIRIDGAYNYFNDWYCDCAPWGANPVNFAGITKTIQHDANGNHWLDVWCYGYANAGGYGPGTCYVSNSASAFGLNLPQIDRTGAVVTLTPGAITTTTVDIGRYWDKTVDTCQYSINSGAWQSEGATVGGITCNANIVSGLTPNTSYTIKIRARRSYNQVWAESNTITMTTHPTPVTLTSASANASTPYAIVVSTTTNVPVNTDYVDVTLGETTQRITGGNGTTTFTGLTESTTYTFTVTAVTLRSGATNSTTITGVTPADAYCYIINPNGTVSSKKKMYLIDTNGIKTEVTKANISVL